MQIKKLEYSVDGFHFYVNDISVSREEFDKEWAQREIIMELKKINKRLNKIERKKIKYEK